MLKHRLLIIVFVCIFWAPHFQCQDPLLEHMITGLKSLKDVTLVFRQNVKVEVLSPKEILDVVELNLRKRVSELHLEKDSRNWLEVSYVTFSEGGFVEVSLYRWVTIIATGEDVFAKVWNDKRMIFGHMKGEDLREATDTLLISFAADFLRANQNQMKAK